MAQITPLSEFPARNDSGQVTITAPFVQLIIANSGTSPQQILLVRKGDGGYFTIVAVVNAEPSPDGKGIETLVNNYESAEYSVIQPNGTSTNLAVYLDSIAGSTATAALQTASNALLTSIDSKLPALATGRIPVDGSNVTQPVSAAALPLPSGAATAAKQPAFGTAGDPSVDVLSVQGVEDGTPVPITGNVVCFSGDTQPVSGTVTANQGTPAAANAPWPMQLSNGATSYTATQTGQLPTSLGIKSAGQALGVAVQQDNYTTVLTGTTAGTQVFNGACCLRQVVILTGATSAVVSISDGSGSPGTAWDIDASSRGVINLNVRMFSGIWVAISGGSPKVLITKD